MIIDVLSPPHRFDCHYRGGNPFGCLPDIYTIVIDPPGWLVFIFTGEHAEENRREVNRSFMRDVLRFYPYMGDLEGVHEMTHSFVWLKCNKDGKPINIPEANDSNLIYWLDKHEWGAGNGYKSCILLY